MRGSRGRRGQKEEANYWPGYVDVLSTLLLVVTFLLSMFMLAQFFVSQESGSKDSLLRRLNRQIAQLTELLAMETGKKKSMQDEMATLAASLSMTREDNKRLSGAAGIGDEKSKAAEDKAGALGKDLDQQKRVTSDAMAQVETLNIQIAALRRQMAALEEALQTSEKKDVEAQDRIKDLGQRLNVALAKKVQELQRYRSDFFGRLRELLANRQGIRVVGDRFVFDAEVLFPSGSADLNVDGLATLDQLASAIRQLEKDIPGDLPWVLRVDGHTDARPIRSALFPSNWELSSARATSVVKFLISRGVAPQNLAAAGFGEFQPIEAGASEDVFRRNRRIELKLDTR
jgi:chemotaxis protein MotB